MPNQWESFSKTLDNYQKRNMKDNLELSGSMGYSPFSGGGVLFGGGRVGYNFNDNVNLGVSGDGYRVTANTPFGKYKESDFRINQVDGRYRWGPNTLSGNFGINGKNWNINYERKF